TGEAAVDVAHVPQVVPALVLVHPDVEVARHDPGGVPLVLVRMVEMLRGGGPVLPSDFVDGGGAVGRKVVPAVVVSGDPEARGQHGAQLDELVDQRFRDLEGGDGDLL